MLAPHLGVWLPRPTFPTHATAHVPIDAPLRYGGGAQVSGSMSIHPVQRGSPAIARSFAAERGECTGEISVKRALLVRHKERERRAVRRARAIPPLLSFLRSDQTRIGHDLTIRKGLRPKGRGINKSSRHLQLGEPPQHKTVAESLRQSIVSRHCQSDGNSICMFVSS